MAGKGIYDAWTFCSTTCSNTHEQNRLASIERETQERIAFQRTLIPNLLANFSAKQIETMFAKTTNNRTSNVNELSADELVNLLETINRRNKQKTSREAKKTNDGKCRRCSGAGRADKWERTGSICYRCDGSGLEPVAQ